MLLLELPLVAPGRYTISPLGKVDNDENSVLFRNGYPAFLSLKSTTGLGRRSRKC